MSAEVLHKECLQLVLQLLMQVIDTRKPEELLCMLLTQPTTSRSSKGRESHVPLNVTLFYMSLFFYMLSQ